MQPECLPARNHLPSDLADTNQPKGASVESTRLGILGLVPLALQQGSHVVGDAAIERQNQAERKLRHCDRILAGAVGDVDAAPRRRSNIDGVVSGAGPNHKLQRTRAENCIGYLRGSDDEYVRLEPPDFLRQSIALQAGLIGDLASGGLEAVEPGLLELVG